MRIGIGFDIHRLAEGRPMVLGGVNIPFPKGPEGHSDGDALLHAICDAILGALSKGDIGMRFPDTDPKYKDISSKELLKDVKGLMDDKGLSVHNLDCVIIAEEPKIGPYREEMAGVIADMLGTSGGNISIKAKTAEKLGAVGKGEAVAAYVVVLLEEEDTR